MKPGLKKITANLEQTETMSLLIDRITKKGSGSVFKTADYAKENQIGEEEMNDVLESLADANLVTLVGTDGESIESGYAKHTTHWKVEGVTIHLKAHQNGLPGTADEEPGEPEED